VVSTTPPPLYPRERPGIHCTGDWVGPRAGLDVCEKSHPHRDFFCNALYLFPLLHSKKHSHFTTCQLQVLCFEPHCRTPASLLCKARVHTLLTHQSPSQYTQVPAHFTVCLGALVYLPPFSSKVTRIVFEGLSALSL
jgi:hypothetical protein